MTHIDNVPHILRYGITHRLSLNANQNYIPIGDSSIINKRKNKIEQTIDGQEFCTGDYIPFHFYARMPMLFNIQNGYGVTQVHAEDIVYLIISIDAIINEPSREYIFSDAHAISKIAKFYGPQHITDIDHLLDIDSIKSFQWSDDYIKKERKQAEFLIKGDIPVDYIEMMCCYSQKVKDKLIGMGAKMRIVVSPKMAYY